VRSTLAGGTLGRPATGQLPRQRLGGDERHALSLQAGGDPVKVFGDLAPLQITFEVVLVAGAVSILAGIVMGLRSKADALLKA
jgi:hypothetical protein